MNPTELSRRYMEKKGYVVANVEKYNHITKRKNDLFGFIDLLCLGWDEVIGIQTTSLSNVSARVKKITDHENVGAVRKAGIGIFVHGWSMPKGKHRYEVKEIDLS